jgi:hypothetical protein
VNDLRNKKEGDEMSLAQTEKYYLPQPSLWPIIGSVALLVMAVGGVMTMRESTMEAGALAGMICST